MSNAKTAEPATTTEVSLYRRILELKERHELDHLAIALYDYETTVQWAYDADRWFHAASTMKLGVLLGVFRQIERGELALNSEVAVRNRFTSIVEGAPFSLDLGRDADPAVYGNLGKTMTVRDLAYHMIITSSNLATNLLIELVGVESVRLALDEIGVSGLRVLRGVEDQRAFDAGLNNEATASGLLSLLRAIAEKRTYSSEASDEMLEILHDQQFRGGIPAGLPDKARVAHKTGNISTVHHDAGIVYMENREPFVLVVLTQFSPEVGRGKAVADVSRDVYNMLAGALG